MGKIHHQVTRQLNRQLRESIAQQISAVFADIDIIENPLNDSVIITLAGNNWNYDFWGGFYTSAAVSMTKAYRAVAQQMWKDIYTNAVSTPVVKPLKGYTKPKNDVAPTCRKSKKRFKGGWDVK